MSGDIIVQGSMASFITLPLKLYDEEVFPSTESTDKYLQLYHHPKLSAEQQLKLEGLVMVLEVEGAIDQLALGKACGLDQRPLELYFGLLHFIVPVLCDVFNLLGTIPRSRTETNVVTFPKKGLATVITDLVNED
ncbi:hypothetical protein NDU88_009448 [Pleurodeles waltl]|uniref:Uncharacterized protein n=1 Tax=Pleurodeles waltl TaxID=8319 RepID=A0AAV7QUJ7_PLEWA|nr:hypothetical protein NDU88_009448 [Pleurodeles waltl]